MSLTILLHFPAVAQDSMAAPAMVQVSKIASKFWQIAPSYVARETLKQKAVVRPKRKLRVGRSAEQQPQADMKEREIISYYAFSSFRASPEALREFREVTAVDGKSAGNESRAREQFLATLASKDDVAKQGLIDEFEKQGLIVAATDFGQLILLFTKANLEKYTFQSTTTGMVGAERAVVIEFRQNAGAGSVKLSDAGKQVRAPLSGELWVREADYLPLRITLTVSRREDSQDVRDEARVDYETSGSGVLLPAAVVHRRFVNDVLFVENIYSYADWRPVK